jgi:hypothetical protein
VRNRIAGYGEMAPDQILANPMNHRRHPGAQLDAFRGALREVGFVQAVIVNRTTSHLIDGHMRVEEALRQGIPKIPVVFVDLDEREERAVLASFDSIGELAYRDNDALRALLDSFTVADAEFNAFLQGLDKPLPDLDPPQDPPGNSGPGLTTCPQCGHTFTK